MGLEYARQLAAKGTSLLLVSNREDELKQASENLSKEFGVQVVTRFQDLAKADAAEDLHRYCAQEGIVPDLIVLNAGMFFFTELSAEVLPKVEAMLELHVMTNTRLAVLFGDDMKKRGKGRIILVSSLASRLPTPGITTYAATKAYLHSFGKSLWFELKPYGVTVTTIRPAAIATPLYKLKPSLMKLGVKTGFIKTPRWLVKRALRASERGRRVVSPSGMNIWLPPLIKAIPSGLELKIWNKLKPRPSQSL